MPAQQLARLNRLYAALTRINRCIVRQRTRDGLLRGICDSLVDDGGFAMAWIGWHDEATHRLVPVAIAGVGGEIEDVQIHTDDRPEGRGPAGIAFRECRPYVCNDILGDPATLPWRATFERRGLRSSAVLPIAPDGVARGVLGVCATTVDYFRDEELTLLGDAAADTAFALEHQETEEARRRAEATAIRERIFANHLIEAMPGLFYLYDEHGKFVRWNRNLEVASGYDDLSTVHPLDLFAEADKPLLAERIAQVFATGEATVEAPLRSREGGSLPYFFTGKRLTLDGVPHLVGVGIDISARTHAEELVKRSEARYRSTLDTIMEACQIVGFDWRYLYLNPSAVRNSRRPASEMVGHVITDVWPGIEATPVFALMRTALEERVASSGEIEFFFADGSSSWFDMRFEPVPEGIFGLALDITERKRAETELRELNERLEAKVVERTHELHAARDRAEVADRMKSAFLATMSHELRTPLNSIIGFTGIVLKEMPGPLNVEQKKQLGMVQISARHLLALINDVLDLSKIEAGALEIRRAPFDICASVEQVAASMALLASKKGLVVRTSAPPSHTIDGDKRRFEQILLNLLNNAIKFTDRGEVTITVDIVADRNASGDSPRSVRIQVADTGMGMKPEDLGLLFQPFRQIDSGIRRQHDGTGLGLAICRRLCDLLGGTITAESRWGAGSVFTVLLPTSPATEP